MIGHESKLKSNVSIQTNMAPQEQQAERKTAGGLFSRMAAHLSHKKKQRTALVQETTHNEELRENIRRQGAAASADGTAEGQPQQKQKPASQTFKKKSKDKRTVRTNTAPTQQAKSQLTPEEVKEREAIYRRVANRLVKDEKGNVTDAKNESDLTFKAAQLAFNKLKENLSGFKETDDAVLRALTEIMEDAVEELQAWDLVEAEKQNVTDAKNEADLIFKAAYRANANLSTASEKKQLLKDALIRIADKAYEKSETVE